MRSRLNRSESIIRKRISQISPVSTYKSLGFVYPNILRENHGPTLSFSLRVILIIFYDIQNEENFQNTVVR